MQDSKTIFKMNKTIEDEQKRLEEELVVLSEKKEELQRECSHDIVFRLYDNTPRKIGIIYHYFCPACKRIVTSHMHKISENSPFEKSRILILEGLDIMNSVDYEEVFDIIQHESFENYTYYYNKDMSAERLSKSMSNTIKEQRNKETKVKQRLLK